MAFENEGVEFKVISEEMTPAVLDFLQKHMAPEEPISRSLGFERSWFMDNLYYKDAIRTNSSIAALDEHGNILAVRIGKIVHRTDYLEKTLDRIFNKLLPLFTWTMGDYMRIMLLIVKLNEFDVWNMFDELNCRTIYEAKALCSARSHGIRGLGTELVKRGEELAKSRGAEHTYVMVTGIYSTRVFENLGYRKLKSLEYAEFKDNNGDLYLKDTREHTHCSVYVKSLD